MGGCLWKSAAQVEAECKEAYAVGIVPADRPRGLDARERLSVDRRDAMASMTLICRLHNEERHITVVGWEEIGASLIRELGVGLVAKVEIGDKEVRPLTLRWEELDVKDGDTVNASEILMKDVLVDPDGLQYREKFGGGQ